MAALHFPTEGSIVAPEMKGRSPLVRAYARPCAKQYLPDRWSSQRHRVRVTLRTKAALLTTSLVLCLVGTASWWQYQQVAGEYLNLMHRQQQSLTDTAAGDLDYKLGMHLAVLGRAAQLAGVQRGDVKELPERGEMLESQFDIAVA